MKASKPKRTPGRCKGQVEILSDIYDTPQAEGFLDEKTSYLPATIEGALHSSFQGRIATYFAANYAIKFAYLFGSCARGQAGPLSDIDLAVYLDNRLDSFNAKLRYLEELYRLLKTERCDLVVLNNAPLILQYEVIRYGKVLKENKQRRVPFETKVIREYLDTEPLRAVHRQKLKEHFLKGRNLGQ